MEIQRAENGGEFFAVGTGYSGTYTDSYLKNETTYRYRVRSVRGRATSEFSNVVSITTAPYPPAPSALSATTVSSTQIDLEWTHSSPHETLFGLERSTDGVHFSIYVWLPADTTSYSANVLDPGATYSIRIYAMPFESEPMYSNVATATTTPLAGDTTAPTAGGGHEPGGGDRSRAGNGLLHDRRVCARCWQQGRCRHPHSRAGGLQRRGHGSR